MALNNITQKVIDLTEEKTGRPVLVTPDSSLSLLATVKPARGSAAVHVVAYNPSAQANADYLVCYQCGFILRLFEVSEQDRYDLGWAPQGISEVEKLVGSHLKEAHLDLDKNTRVGFQDQLFNGLMLQLRSVSVGLRVDDWLRRDYPDLGSQQRAMAARQLNENAAALPSSKARYPASRRPADNAPSRPAPASGDPEHRGTHLDLGRSSCHPCLLAYCMRCGTPSEDRLIAQDGAFRGPRLAGGRPASSYRHAMLSIPGDDGTCGKYDGTWWA